MTPLYVQVGEALTGETAFHWYWDGLGHGCKRGENPKTGSHSWGFTAPPPGATEDRDGFRFESGGPLYWTSPEYDTDWKVTGPLLDRFGFDLTALQGVGARRYTARAWLPLGESAVTSVESVEAATALLAICGLIVRLGAMGKL